MAKQTFVEVKKKLQDAEAKLKGLEAKGNKDTITMFQLIAYSAGAFLLGLAICKFF